MPYGQKATLYDALGLNRDAKQSDIIRTYRRLSGELKKESSAPNPRREALVHEAYEVLSDPQRRAAYDKSLARDEFLGKSGGAPAGRKWGLAVAAIAVALGGAWYYLNVMKKESAPIAAISVQEIQTAASVAVGRVNRIEMSGARSNLGVAVAIDEGIMMAPCQGIGPGATLLVRIPPRDIPAQVRHADEAVGLCRIAVSGGASWPLPMTALVPKVGATVYAASLGSLGEVVIVPGEVKKVTRGQIGAVIESTAKVGPPIDGTPLLDDQGRVVAVALAGQHTTLPSSWVVDAPIRKRPPPKAADPEPEGAPPAAGDTASGTQPRDVDPRLKNVPPEKIERLEKAFRPPPNIPKDL